MTRAWFVVHGVATVTKPKWRKLRPIDRGAVLTLWMVGSTRQPECRWSDRDDVIETLRIDGFREPDRVVDRLIESGWLDCSDGACVVHDWDEWQKPIPMTPAERQRKHRERVASRDVTDVTNSRDGHERFSPLLSSDDEEDEPNEERPSTNGKVSSTEAAAGDVFDAYYATTLRYPTDRVIPWLNDLETEHGAPAVVDAMRAAWSESMDVRSFLSRVSTKLVSARERAARERDAAERRQQAARQAAAERRVAPPPDRQPTPEEIEAGRRAYAELRERFGSHRNNGMASASDAVVPSGRGDPPAATPAALKTSKGTDSEDVSDRAEAEPSLLPGPDRAYRAGSPATSPAVGDDTEGA